MANVALGKTIEEACVNVKAVTDGNITRYDGQTGYCAFPWPANLTLDLQETNSVECIRFLLWDRDARTYKYRLLTSLDHREWQVLYVSPVEGSRGWQSFRFEKALSCRFVRLHCLHNTANPAFQVVQLQVWNSQPDSLPTTIVNDQVIANLLVENERETVTLDITQEFERLSDELERIGREHTILNSERLKLLVQNLRSYALDIGKIERSMDAVKRHITEPVEKKLQRASEESRRIGRYTVFSLLVGIIGGALAIVTLLLELIWHCQKG